MKNAAPCLRWVLLVAVAGVAVQVVGGTHTAARVQFGAVTTLQPEAVLSSRAGAFASTRAQVNAGDATVAATSSVPESNQLRRGFVQVFDRPPGAPVDEWVAGELLRGSAVDGRWDGFGAGLRFNRDGTLLVVASRIEETTTGSVEEGAIYVFERTSARGVVPSRWALRQRFRVPNKYRDTSVWPDSLAMSADGEYVTIGLQSPEIGNPAESVTNAVAVFHRDDDGLFEHETILFNPAPTPFNAFGISMSLSHDGSVLAVGAGNTQSFTRGGAMVFRRIKPHIWKHEATLSGFAVHGESQFGTFVDMDETGRTVVVSRTHQGSFDLHVFMYAEDSWEEAETLDVPSVEDHTLSGRRPYLSAVISGDGSTIVATERSAVINSKKSAWVFRRGAVTTPTDRDAHSISFDSAGPTFSLTGEVPASPSVPFSLYLDLSFDGQVAVFANEGAVGNGRSGRATLSAIIECESETRHEVDLRSLECPAKYGILLSVNVTLLVAGAMFFAASVLVLTCAQRAHRAQLTLMTFSLGPWLVNLMYLMSEPFVSAAALGLFATFLFASHTLGLWYLVPPRADLWSFALASCAKQLDHPGHALWIEPLNKLAGLGLALFGSLCSIGQLLGLSNIGGMWLTLWRPHLVDCSSSALRRDRLADVTLFRMLQICSNQLLITELLLQQIPLFVLVNVNSSGAWTPIGRTAIIVTSVSVLLTFVRLLGVPDLCSTGRQVRDLSDEYPDDRRREREAAQRERRRRREQAAHERRRGSARQEEDVVEEDEVEVVEVRREEPDVRRESEVRREELNVEAGTESGTESVVSVPVHVVQVQAGEVEMGALDLDGGRPPPPPPPGAASPRPPRRKSRKKRKKKSKKRSRRRSSHGHRTHTWNKRRLEEVRIDDKDAPAMLFALLPAS